MVSRSGTQPEPNIILLEKVDEALLRGLLTAHSKIPIEALYLDTKSVPIRYIAASRRLRYLHNILQKEESEMVRQIYEVQKEDTSPGGYRQYAKRKVSETCGRQSVKCSI